MIRAGAASDAVVVDTSLAVKWVVAESDSPAAHGLLAGWLASGVQPIAPTFLAVEVANVLFGAARSGALSLADAQAALRLVLIAVEFRDVPMRDTARAMEIAQATGQKTPYDALSLALAEREGCEYRT